MTTENTGTDQVDESSAPITVDTSSDTGKQDDVFEKHINIALEAQDGKAEATGAEGDTKKPEGEGKQPTGTDSNSSGANNAAQQKPDEAGKKDEKGARGPQDLVLKGQGPNGTDLVIKGGPERRFYEQHRIAKDELRHTRDLLTRTQNNYTKLQGEFETMRKSVEQVQGMQPQQLAVATTLYKDLQRDPVGTLQKLLAEATGKGYKIDGIASGVDVEAIKAAVRSELGASLTPQQGLSDEEIVAEAEREAATFFSTFPDARLHEPLMVKVMQDNPGVDLHTVYFSLRENFASRGFDWSRPLDDQLLERQQQNVDPNANAQQQQQNNQQQNNQPGLPAGRPASAASTDANAATVAHESTSIDDIIKQSMREAGLKV